MYISFQSFFHVSIGQLQYTQNNEGDSDTKTRIQLINTLVSNLHTIKYIAYGADHVLAAGVNGAVFTRGSGILHCHHMR